MRNLIKIFSIGFMFLIISCSQCWGADSGDCGPNCWYTYANGTLTYSVKDVNDSTPAVINKRNDKYELSGIVQNVTISEGITKVESDSGNYSTIRFDTIEGGGNGKLILPKSLTDFEWRSTWEMGFSSVEINSENLYLNDESFRFRSGAQPTIILSANSNINFSDISFYSNGSYVYPSSLHIACKGKPDSCLEKFGASLSGMNQNNIHVDYYNEKDGEGHVTLQYFDNGYRVLNDQGFYDVYDMTGNLTGYSNLNGREIYDEKGTLLERYDENGNMIDGMQLRADGSFSILKDGKVIGFKNKRIYTIDEATAAVRGNKNTFTLKYR